MAKYSNSAPGLGCLSNFCVFLRSLLCLQQHLGIEDLSVFQRERSQHLHTEWLEEQLLKLCKYIQSCETTNISSTIYQSQGTWKCPLGSCHKIGALDKYISCFGGRCWWVEQGRGWVPRWSPQCKFFESRSLGFYMCVKPEACSSGQSSRTKKPPLQKDWGMCLSILSMNCPGGGNLPRTICLIARVL